MTIKRCDGTPYQVIGSVQQFDPLAPEHALFDSWDQEAIQRGGLPIYYYESFLQTQTIDPIFMEDRGKLYSNNPIMLWGVYDPQPSQNIVGQFGIDGLEEQKFEFNYRAVLQAIGHPPKLDSRLYTPHLRQNWRIVQRNLGEFKMWGALRLQIIVQLFQESITTGEGKVSQKTPDIKIL